MFSEFRDRGNLMNCRIGYVWSVLICSLGIMYLVVGTLNDWTGINSPVRNSVWVVGGIAILFIGVALFALTVLLKRAVERIELVIMDKKIQTAAKQDRPSEIEK